MLFFRLIPVILSFLLLSAHFSRDSQALLGLLAVVFPILLFIKKAWIAKLFQITLILATLEWLRAMFDYIQIRQLSNSPYTALVIILSIVSLFTLLSALIFRLKSVRKAYR